MVIRAKQSLGQNFLVDENTAWRIVNAYGLSATDVVLEVGPGYGILTALIADRVNKLYAVEIDRRFYDFLKQRFQNQNNIILCHQDILKVDMEKMDACSVRVVGNIPYHITSRILFHILDYRHLVRDMILLIQREMAERIIAAPGTKDYGILSVISQTFATVQGRLRVPRTVFAPRPKVDSMLVRWRFVEVRAEKIKNEVLFRTLVRTAFQQRRKMLRNSLRQWMDSTHPWAGRRPETLSVDEWIELSNECI